MDTAGDMEGNLSRGTENGPLRLCSGRVLGHFGSGKNQGKLKINQLQLTLDYPSSGLQTKKGSFVY